MCAPVLGGSWTGRRGTRPEVAARPPAPHACGGGHSGGIRSAALEAGGPRNPVRHAEGTGACQSVEEAKLVDVSGNRGEEQGHGDSGVYVSVNFKALPR